MYPASFPILQSKSQLYTFLPQLHIPQTPCLVLIFFSMKEVCRPTVLSPPIVACPIFHNINLCSRHFLNGEIMTMRKG